MKDLKKLWLISAMAAIVALSGCSTDDPSSSPEPLTAGDTDFTRVVVIGASYEAGYRDSHVPKSTDRVSYPGMVAEQMGLTVGATADMDFVEAAFSEGVGGKLTLTGFDANGSPIITTTSLPTNPANVIPTNATLARPYNNLGVPGALAHEVLLRKTGAAAPPLFPAANPFFDLILRPTSASQKSQVEQAAALQPTFVIIGLLGNDVLGAVTSGMTRAGLPIAPANYAQAYGGIVQALKAVPSIKGMVGVNIPDVTAIPFVTTIPRTVTVSGTTIALVIQTSETTTPVRQTVDGDYILLPASSYIGNRSGSATYGGVTFTWPAGVPLGLHATAPLPSFFVLDKTETATANQAITAYNAAIAQVAASAGFPILDAHTFFDQVKEEGTEYGGIDFSTSFITGGLFSLDGVHFNETGYAIMANELIGVINDYYHSTITMVNIPEHFAGN